MLYSEQLLLCLFSRLLFFYHKSYLELDFGPPVPAGTLGDELSPSGTIIGNTPGFMSVTATDTHFLHIFSSCILPCPAVHFGLPHLTNEQIVILCDHYRKIYKKFVKQLRVVRSFK